MRSNYFVSREGVHVYVESTLLIEMDARVKNSKGFAV